MRWIRRGQSTAEYAIAVGVVVAAVIAMQVYVKRSIQAKVKAVADDNREFTESGLTTVKGQYEPYYTAAGAITTTETGSRGRQVAAGYKVTTTETNLATDRTGTTEQGVTLTADDNWQ